MGSNLFSDMFKGTSDFLESIPIVGEVLKTADKVAVNTDPSQLAFSAVGKLLGGEVEEHYTGEEARKGAGHTIGMAALAYLLSGAGAASEGAAATPEVGQAAGIAAESNFAADAAIYGGAGVEAEGMTPLAAYTLGGAPAAEYGLTVTGAPATVGEVAPLSSYTMGQAPTTAEKLLSAQNIKSVMKAGKTIYSIGNQEGQPTISTSPASSGRQVDPETQDINKLMGDALGPDQSSLIFDKKGITLKNSDQNAMYKSFLGGDGGSRVGSSMLTQSKGDLAFRTIKPEPLTDTKEENKYSGMKNTSVASPFYQPTA